jgi:hypothetical protein
MRACWHHTVNQRIEVMMRSEEHSASLLIPRRPWQSRPERWCAKCGLAATVLVQLGPMHETRRVLLEGSLESKDPWRILACEEHCLEMVNQLLELVPDDFGPVDSPYLGVRAIDLRTSWRRLLIQTWSLPLVNARLRLTHGRADT